ncbi:hypothetical protein [Spiroplasma endosymbiont of Nebria brevicollis]|uniref:hypothetical protein n=1 Tax=Spiroplasma endosymbiont of Nebria brevicollis TaxID=3066284 RepID=UPI00313B4D13
MKMNLDNSSEELKLYLSAIGNDNSFQLQTINLFPNIKDINDLDNSYPEATNQPIAQMVK